MSKINLSASDINRAASFTKEVFKQADANKTGKVRKSEIDKFQGKGKATIANIYKFAQHVEKAHQTGNGDHRAVAVSMVTLRASVDKIASGLKNKAKDVGDKDGQIDGNELPLVSKSGASLARLAHTLSRTEGSKQK